MDKDTKLDCFYFRFNGNGRYPHNILYPTPHDLAYISRDFYLERILNTVVWEMQGEYLIDGTILTVDGNIDLYTYRLRMDRGINTENKIVYNDWSSIELELKQIKNLMFYDFLRCLDKEEILAHQYGLL